MAKTILVLAANPKDTPSLRLDQEIREIDNGLERAQKRDEFVLKQKLAARPIDVRRAMLDYKPNIVHFCGHGSGEEGIAFEDESGKANLVSADALAGFFELFADKVECLVLNACYSEVQAEAIAQHIPYVIGMNKAIGDSAAIEFAVAFYDALGAGESVRFAYRLACNAIQWANIPEHLTPVLKTKFIGNVQEITTPITAFCYLNKEGIDDLCTKFSLDLAIQDKYSHKIALLLSRLKEQDLLAFSLEPSEKRFTYVAAEFSLVDDDQEYLAFQAKENNRVRMNFRKTKSTLWPYPTKMPRLNYVAIAARFGVEFQVFGEWYSDEYLRPHAIAIVGDNLGGYNTLTDN